MTLLCVSNQLGAAFLGPDMSYSLCLRTHWYWCPLALLLVLAGCKPGDSDPIPTIKSCQLATIAEPGIERQISYDAEGRIASISNTSSTPGSDKYQYFGNYAIIQRASFLGVPAKDSITWNTAGLMTTRHAAAVSNPSFWYHQDFSYNAGNELQSIITYSSSSPSPSTQTFTWKEGDLLATSYGETFEYDTSKLAEPGDLFSFRNLTQEGWPTVRTRHLPVAHISGSSRGMIQYSRDAKGRIEKMEIMYVNGYGAKRSVGYSYHCQ